MSCSFSGCAALEANNIYSTVEWWFHDVLSGLVLSRTKELEYAMMGLKCQSCAKLGRGMFCLGGVWEQYPFCWLTVLQGIATESVLKQNHLNTTSKKAFLERAKFLPSAGLVGNMNFASCVR